MWQAWFDGPLKGKRITRVIATHCHPDHIGLAGWLCERFGVSLYSSQTEYLDTLCVRLDPSALDAEPYRSFYHSHGLSEALTQTVLKRGLQYLRMVSPLPRTFRRVIAGEKLRIGGRKFDVHDRRRAFLRAGHALLRRAERVPLRRSGDGQDHPQHQRRGDRPRRRPARHLSALARSTCGARIPEDALALPGHNLPFVGLNVRIGELVAHHEARCRAILAACADAPRSVFELVPVMFGRPIEDPHQMSFAFSEALAHANFLVRRDHLKVVKVGDGLAMQAVK